MNMYVGNLSYNVTEEELRGIFSEYGEVSSHDLDPRYIHLFIAKMKKEDLQ